MKLCAPCLRLLTVAGGYEHPCFKQNANAEALFERFYGFEVVLIRVVFSMNIFIFYSASSGFKLGLGLSGYGQNARNIGGTYLKYYWFLYIQKYYISKNYNLI